MEVIGLKEKLAGNRLLKSNMFPAFFCVDNLATILKKQGKKLLKAYI